MSYLIHFNHNHDKLGRFTTSDRVSVQGIDTTSKDYVIKKDTRIDRVTTTNKEINVGRTYATFTESDRNEYLSVCKDWLGATHKMQLKTTKDVKVAGKSTQADAFANILKTTDIKDLVAHNNSGTTRADKKEQRNLTKIYKNAYKSQDKFDEALFKFNQGLTYGKYHNENLSNRFYSELNKKGYDAAVDLNDLNFAENPVIFIKREDSLKQISVSEITQQDIDSAQIWLRERGYI